jgi:Ni,Fe-hydrogenase III small subunit
MNSNFWFLKGITKGIQTEKFPDAPPEDLPLWETEIEGNGNVNCPTNAITEDKWNAEKCISCRRCFPNYKPTGRLVEIDVKNNVDYFKRSFHIYAMDIGACGACNVELNALSYPEYDFNRLGIFFTNTPRHADAIIVMGIYTEKMKESFLAAYDAMPNPKIVVALGACAINGGILGKAPVSDSIVNIPGCPPNPYLILETLLKLKGSK